MDHPSYGSEIDKAVQLLPATSAEPSNHSAGGSKCQGDKQYKAYKSHGDKGTLYHISHHLHEFKKLIQPNVGDKMQADVKKGEQAQHPPEPYKPVVS
jgi:hypothetical protein